MYVGFGMDFYECLVGFDCVEICEVLVFVRVVVGFVFDVVVGSGRLMILLVWVGKWVIVIDLFDDMFVYLCCVLFDDFWLECVVVDMCDFILESCYGFVVFGVMFIMLFDCMDRLCFYVSVWCYFVFVGVFVLMVVGGLVVESLVLDWELEIMVFGLFGEESYVFV